MKLYILLLTLICLASCLQAKPYISTLTCEEYWAYHEKMIDIKAPDRKENEREYFKQLSKFWDYELQRFKKDNNNFDVTSLNEMKNGSYNVMLIYQACEFRPGNLKNNASDNMQRTLYDYLFNQTRLEQAQLNACNLHNIGSFTTITNSHTNFFYECMDKNFGSMKISKLNANSVRLCINPNRENICKEIVSSAEGYCLSKFGECTPNKEGRCAWAHTISSRECLH